MGPPTTICSVICRKVVGNSSPLLTQYKSTWVKHHMGLLSVLSQVLNFLMIFAFLPKTLKWNIFVAALINVCMLGPEKLSGLYHNSIPWLYPDVLAQFHMNLNITITPFSRAVTIGSCWVPGFALQAGSVLQSCTNSTVDFQDADLASWIELTFKMEI